MYPSSSEKLIELLETINDVTLTRKGLLILQLDFTVSFANHKGICFCMLAITVVHISEHMLRTGSPTSLV